MSISTTVSNLDVIRGSALNNAEFQGACHSIAEAQDIDPRDYIFLMGDATQDDVYQSMNVLALEIHARELRNIVIRPIDIDTPCYSVVNEPVTISEAAVFYAQRGRSEAFAAIASTLSERV